jgi:hypothetical protein
MRITSIQHRGGSHQSTIPIEIMHALGAALGDHIYWTWNTSGYAEVRRILRPDELDTRTPTPKNPRKLRRPRRET